jgi:hypothetical protein
MRRFLVFGGLVLGGCGSDSPLEEAFCDLLENGPAVSVTAEATGGPEGFVDANRVDVTLPDDGSGQFAGELTFTTDEAGSFAVGLSTDVPVELRDSSGTVIPLGSPVTSDTCAPLALRYTVDLVLASYTLSFGPTSVETFSLVAEESDDDG